MIRYLPWLLLIALAGLLISIVIHLMAVFGWSQPEGLLFLPHLAIFALAPFAVILQKRLTRGSKKRNDWRMALRGCPAWMQWVCGAFFFYAGLNFAWFMFNAPPKGPPGAPPPPEVLRGFSGHWMAFYSALAALFYSAMMVERREAHHRCRDGHPLSPLASHCTYCGADLATDDDSPESKEPSQNSW